MFNSAFIVLNISVKLHYSVTLLITVTYIMRWQLVPGIKIVKLPNG